MFLLLLIFYVLKLLKFMRKSLFLCLISRIDSKTEPSNLLGALSRNHKQILFVGYVRCIIL